MKTILILEDNDERIAAFEKTVAALGDGFELKVWRDAPSMIAECEAFFPTTALISLDHDLNPMPGTTVDPGTGLDVARFLGDFMPVCPVLIHSSNTDRVYSMHNELRFAGLPQSRGWVLRPCTAAFRCSIILRRPVGAKRVRVLRDGSTDDWPPGQCKALQRTTDLRR